MLPPVAAVDLVDANGGCAGAAPPATASGEGVPMIPAAIALEMTECDVVKRAGAPEKVDIGANERGERTATLTYIRGEKPGIYYFAGRPAAPRWSAWPEPSAASAKPAKKKPAKPKSRAKPSQ